MWLQGYQAQPLHYPWAWNPNSLPLTEQGAKKTNKQVIKVWHLHLFMNFNLLLHMAEERGASENYEVQRLICLSLLTVRFGTVCQNSITSKHFCNRVQRLCLMYRNMEDHYHRAFKVIDCMCLWREGDRPVNAMDLIVSLSGPALDPVSEINS